MQSSEVESPDREAEALPSAPRAWLVQDNPMLDFSPLKEYASWPPVVIFPPGQVTLSPEAAVAHARERLATFAAGDFLLLIGDPVAISICFMIAAEKIAAVKVLRWDRREKVYLPITIKL